MNAVPASQPRSSAPAPAQFSHEADAHADPAGHGARAARTNAGHDYLGSPFTPGDATPG